MTAKSHISRPGAEWRFAGGVMGVFLVLAIVAWLVSQRLVDARHATARTALEQRMRSIQRLEAENGRLRTVQRELEARVPSLAAALPPESEAAVLAERDAKRVAGMTLMLELETIGAISQNTSLHDCFRVDRSGRLPHSFARLFDLPAAQFEKLQEALRAAKEHLEATAISRTRVRRENDAKLVLEVEIAPEWTVQRERLRQVFFEVLGSEQMRVFERLGRSFDHVCASMETKNWSVVVTRRPMNSAGAGGFGYEVVGVNRGSVWSNRDVGVPRRTVESSLGRWAQFLPADF